MNPPILKSNNSVKSFKRNNHFDVENTKDGDNSFSKNKRKSKKNLDETQMF